MPFPLFHLAFGALPKAALGRNFSFTAFAGANGLMDIEPALKMYGGLPGPIHGITHTWPGALVIAALAVALFMAWQRYAPARMIERIGRANLAVVVISVLLGTLSHVVLDATMHADMSVALVGLQPGFPNMDNPSAPFPFAEVVAMLALMVAIAIWIGRWMLSLAFRQIQKIVLEKSGPKL